MIKYILIFCITFSAFGQRPISIFTDGWVITMKGGTQANRNKALSYLKGDLKLIKKIVPQSAIPYMQSVKIVLGVPSNQGWAKHDNLMGEIQFKSVEGFVNGRAWYPDVLLHEMAHVYQAKALRYNLKPLIDSFKKHKARYKARGKNALKLKARPVNTLHLGYASSNEYEFFAEMSTVLFGVHRAWEKMDRETEVVMLTLWGMKPKVRPSRSTDPFMRGNPSNKQLRMSLRRGRRILK